jgi:hypothetical protein
MVGRFSNSPSLFLHISIMNRYPPEVFWSEHSQVYSPNFTINLLQKSRKGNFI